MTMLTYSLRPSLRRAFLMVTCLSLMVLTGCASGPNKDPRDPFEPFNRSMWKFNEGLDKAVLKPVAETYKEVTPTLMRKGVSNFFANLSDFWSTVNNALQLKPLETVESLMRFNMNTFLGLGGLIDVASEFNIERHREDFGQTLGRWGVPSGPYLVVPFMGPSTVRDTAARAFNATGDPVRYMTDVSLRNELYLLRIVDLRASLLRAGGMFDEAALDRYSFARDVFLQVRQREVLGDKDEVPPDDPASTDTTPSDPSK